MDKIEIIELDIKQLHHIKTKKEYITELCHGQYTLQEIIELGKEYDRLTQEK